MPPKNLPPLDVPAILRAHGLRPKKSLGQNFLTSEKALRQVVSAAGLTEDDTVLEVGAGLGSLTRHLAARAGRVFAVEIDNRLLPPLREVLLPHPNVTVVQADILALDIPGLLGGGAYKVAANIPYYLTSNLIRYLLENQPPPDRLVLTIQEEVARRICAGPGEMSILAASVQVYGEPRIAAALPPGCFYPEPKVGSAILRIDLHESLVVPPEDLPVFFRLVKAGFSSKRKNLRNALSGGLGWPKEKAVALLEKEGIDPARRAETLALEEWAGLTRAYRMS